MGKRERKTWAPVGLRKVILISAKQGLDWGVCLRPVQDSTELVWYQSQFGTRKAALYGRHLDMTQRKPPLECASTERLKKTCK